MLENQKLKRTATNNKTVLVTPFLNLFFTCLCKSWYCNCMFVDEKSHLDVNSLGEDIFQAWDLSVAY